MLNKNVCILGGGGFVGRHLASQLAARGWRITVPARQRQRAKDLLVLPGIEVVQTDVHDPEVLARLCAGQDAVINLVGILHGSERAFTAAHVELPAKAMAACQAAGVRRFLHMSALGADPASRSLYQRSKGEGERRVLDLGRQYGIDVTVFRPSVIFGPGDSFLTLFAGLLGMAPVVPLANAGTRFQPVHVVDVARAFADAVGDPESHGQAYNLCGPEVYNLAQLVGLVAATLGLKRLILPLGAGASYWFARAMELKPGTKLMTRDNHYAMQTDNVCPDGFPARFGQPRGLAASLDYLRGGRQDQYDGYRTVAGR
ncbi:complex I NDUFA9 subunit family protein [Parasulfuritortus cantonensis]|uniref:Complex I NDUFA9 subunit family protein n=1 Tax=Parasulfuritortus cantonensis TaxID=2528202 RepID=A0A4R1BGP5_9PROT|nr:complex I NDUFA9 subunit family protein [Parasulfuritortus cantonensis]TCJ16337.1 complex I NDUFA9 subunit family protein [Parasulfuritortus cantonensis]